MHLADHGEALTEQQFRGLVVALTTAYREECENEMCWCITEEEHARSLGTTPERALAEQLERQGGREA